MKISVTFQGSFQETRKSQKPTEIILTKNRREYSENGWFYQDFTAQGAENESADRWAMWASKIFLCVLGQVLCRPAWSQILCVAKYDLKLLMPLPQLLGQVCTAMSST